MERLSLNTRKPWQTSEQSIDSVRAQDTVLAGQVIVRGCSEAVRSAGDFVNYQSGFQMGDFVANLAIFPGEGAVRLKIKMRPPTKSGLPRGRCASKQARLCRATRVAVVQVSLTMSRCRAADSSSETVQTPKPVRGNREETKGCLLADVFDEDDNGNDHDNEHDEGDNDD
jgi:hypothetical protein